MAAYETKPVAMTATGPEGSEDGQSTRVKDDARADQAQMLSMIPFSVSLGRMAWEVLASSGL